MLGRLQLIKTHLGYKLQSVIQFNSPNITWLQIHELLNISYGLLCASRRVSLVYTNLFKFDCETSNFFAYVNHARICSWNQPVPSNESKVSCSRSFDGMVESKRVLSSILCWRKTDKTNLPNLMTT